MDIEAAEAAAAVAKEGPDRPAMRRVLAVLQSARCPAGREASPHVVSALSPGTRLSDLRISTGHLPGVRLPLAYRSEAL